MPTDQILINLPQIQSVPLDYKLPQSQEIALQAARAIFDGSSAATSFLPALQIIGPGGVIAATFVDPTTPIAAGGVAEVTFGTFLGRKTSGTGSGFLVALLQTNPNALWKLDEQSGSTAFDSLSGAHNAGAIGGGPTWQALQSPVSTRSPHFATGQGFTTTLSSYQPDLTGDFTAAVWFRQHTQQGERVYGTSTTASANTGWGFLVNGPSDANPNKLAVAIGTGSAVVQIVTNLTITQDVWYWFVVTHSGVNWTLYQNAVAQTSTYGGAYSSGGGRILWWEHDGSNPLTQHDSYESYVTLWATRALSSSEITNIYSKVGT